ncbi:hypothetical protein OAU00_02710 [Saprospiraceae bacterium]|nr:hypothetical protein [Saprospiraceae bacterium]
MAKQAKAQKVEVAPQEEAATITAAPVKPTKPEWEIKDRVYYLKGNKNPLTLTIPGKHTRKHALLYFDEKTGKQREIRYATNQDSPLVDEQKGEVTMGHIRFLKGSLTVEKSKQNLQKLLSLYHPLKGKLYEEFSAKEEAIDDLSILDLQIDALNAIFFLRASLSSSISSSMIKSSNNISMSSPSK